MTHSTKRDSWGSKWGFILACIGSAVGMGNIWLFPARVSKYGGATFLIPYLIFVVIIGSTGVIGEMAFGRATRSGPIHAFGTATQLRFGTEKPGKLLGLIPVLGSLAMAIGYSVVTGWIFKYTAGAITGSLSALDGLDAFSAQFGATASGNTGWQVAGMAVTIVIMAFGVGKGIEKANKIMTPLFFLLFVGLAVYLVTLPGSAAGYQYIFVLKPEGLLDPMVWVFALGQAFFSLSIAGNGTLIYGSYLSNDSDVPADAKMVALFDTCAAILAALVIIPAMAVAGQQLDKSGPGLMFIFLPNVLKGIPGGGVILIVFFVAVTFAALTSLINLFEAPTATLQELFHLKRPVAVAIIGAIGIGVGLAIAPIVSDWMDVCSIYICPIGALLAGIMFFWVCGKDYVLEQVNLARSKPLGSWFYPMAKYLFCGVTLIVLILGASVQGGIG
ncbi:sodium-dependent transporter [Pseudoflavonifractor phocaeensis]|uniref:sodium-dependent transporter n=1 Tax=Pseudoflavonifractor phocaeensis TaxID=1870988 RepID=UPI001F2C8F47|nr:sodium-dependent transporter [Pseudoflavonifractor phocaeensis]MCF2595261.1 sodium-dependent transporter [Pseudoflavonifractor phocaeensis]